MALYGASVPLASVYPLVTTRVLARPFTYEVEEGVGKGAVVSMPLGRSQVRGVVVGDEAAMPEGVRPVPVNGVVDEVSAGPRRSRAVGGRVLRLDAGAGALARGAACAGCGAANGARPRSRTRSRPRRRRSC